MRKLFMAALFIACTSSFALAQTGDDYNKYDVGVLYSHNRQDIGVEAPNQNFLEEREGFHGFEAFVKGNVSRYVGLKGSYSFNRKSFDIVGNTAATTFDVDANLHQFLGGVEFKDNARETSVKPFAHVLAGVGHARADVSNNTVSFDESETGFAAAIGGGVDFRLSDRVDLRAVQFDYNPTRDNGQTSHNFRVGIGLIFR
ncbi:MAG TPA: outer membrane beta-barrel protein [Pyrinomonadaceae bacterium]|nr:outer membrane beta-barrel protein [Pyrinomonadaceae bacterium]